MPRTSPQPVPPAPFYGDRLAALLWGTCAVLLVVLLCGDLIRALLR